MKNFPEHAWLDFSEKYKYVFAKKVKARAPRYTSLRLTFLLSADTTRHFLVPAEAVGFDFECKTLFPFYVTARFMILTRLCRVIPATDRVQPLSLVPRESGITSGCKDQL